MSTIDSTPPASDVVAASGPSEPVSGPDYVRYWNAWLVLLGITALMLFMSSTAIVVVGMSAKAVIIAAWFMHLKQERFDFILYVAVSIVFFSAILFGLILPDGQVM